MKHHSKLVILGLAATLVMTSLTGCLHRKKTTYQTYMQNILDVNYKGSFDGYVKDNDGSEEDASAMYSDSIDYLAGQLINHYSLNNAETDEVDAIFDETAKVIYSKAKYEVSRAYKSGSDYYVDVTVYPMDILNQAFDDVFAYIDAITRRSAPAISTTPQRKITRKNLPRACRISFRIKPQTWITAVLLWSL